LKCANVVDSRSPPRIQFKLLVAGLTALYMGHCKALSRVRPFIEAGGLVSLVELVGHPNLHVASQALSTLLNITDETLFPWHSPPGYEEGKRGPGNDEDRLMWRRMFELSRSSFIASLLRHQPDTFPGSSMLVLRLLAFYTSWLRYHFTPNRVLRLSSSLLDLLKVWSRREGIIEEEKRLAKQLYDDFSRFPPAEMSADPQLGSDARQTTVEDDDDGGGVGTTLVVEDRTQINHYEPSEADGLKARGNVAYKEGRYSEAIQLYSAALDVPVHSSRLLCEGPRRAVLHTNRAAAYLARGAAMAAMAAAAAGPLRECGEEADSTGLLEGLDLGERGALRKHWEAAVMDADSAIGMDEGYVKAYLRKSQGLSRLQRVLEALLAAEEGLRRSSSSSSGAGEGKGGDAGAHQELSSVARELKAKLSPSALETCCPAAAAAADDDDDGSRTEDGTTPVMTSSRDILSQLSRQSDGMERSVDLDEMD